jgi:glutamate-1-semialdehyde 2,1-aminomutase
MILGTQSLIESHHSELAAVLVEPLQRVISPIPGFLQGLRELTETYKIPLIFDEVVTGFRLSYGGAQGHYGVTPDLCSVGKIMGGGYALAAVMGKADIMSVYNQSEVSSDDYVNQIGTLNGNPIACAAGLATLDQLKQPGAYEKLRKTGKTIRDALVSICADNNIPVQSSGDDTIFDIFFSESPVTNYRQGLLADSQTMNKFNTELLRHGILKSWPQKYYPSLAHTDDDIAQTIQAFKEVVPSLRS